jgi:hypothetical protein
VTTIYRNEPERKFQGASVAVGWEVSATRAIYFCTMCTAFHIATDCDTGDAHGSCPRLPEGAKVAILTCGPVPEQILWAIYRGVLNHESVGLLREAYQVLDGVLGAPPEATA